MSGKTFSDLVGQTIVSTSGLTEGSDHAEFVLAGGERVVLFHESDCCEHVSIAEVHGDPADLVGEVTLAVESSNREDKPDCYADSWTWTFYRIGTMKGTVVLRWLGESNGYYSESVTCAWHDV